MGFRVRDGDKGRHIVVMVEKDVNLHSTLSCSEFRLGEQGEVKGDGGGIEGHELVLEPELFLTVSKRACGAKMIRQPPEKLLEEFGRAMAVSIRKCGPRGWFLYPEMDELTVAAAEAVNNFPERIRSCQMTEKHGYKLGFTSKTLCVALSACYGD